MADKQGNVVSISEVRLPELRGEITELRERLQRVTDVFIENEANFGVVTDIVLAIQSADTLQGLDEAIGTTITRESGDLARFYVPEALLPDETMDYVHSIESLSESTRKSLEALSKTQCEVCRADSYEELMRVSIADVGSMAKIPVAYESLRGVLVIGAEDADLFGQDVGTLYLDFIGATLARTAIRVLGLVTSES